MSQLGATSVFHSGRAHEGSPAGREATQRANNDASSGELPVFADLLGVNKRPVLAALDMDATSVAASSGAATKDAPDAHESRLRRMNAEANDLRRSQRRGLAADGRAAGVREANARASRFQPSPSQRSVAPGDVRPMQGAALQLAPTDVAIRDNAAGRAGMTQHTQSGDATALNDRFAPNGGFATNGGLSAGLDNRWPHQPADSRNAGDVNARTQSSKAIQTAPPSRAGGGMAGVSTNAAEQIGKLLGAKSGPSHADRSFDVQPVVGDRGATQPRNVQQGPRTGGKADAQPDAKPADVKSETTRSAGRSDFERLFESIRVRGGQDRSTARMRLQPPELGRIQIDVRLDGDRLDLRIEAESRGAEEVLRARIGQLRDAFAQHGIHLGRTDIVTADSEGLMESTDGRNDAAAGADGQSKDEWSDFGERQQDGATSGAAGGASTDAGNDESIEGEQVIALDALLDAYSLLDVVA